MGRTLLTALLLALPATISPALVAPLAAQEWSADMRVGRLDFRLDAAPTTTSMGVGITRHSADGRASFTAGIPMSDEDPLWGALDLGERVALVETGPLSLGLDLASQAFLQRYSRSLAEEPGPGGGIFDRVTEEGASFGWGLATQLLPFVAYGTGPVSLEARGGFSSYRTALGEHTAQRNLMLADARVMFTPLPALGFSLQGRHFMAEERDWTFGGVRAVLALPGLDLWGSAGHWFQDTTGIVPLSAGAAIPLASRLELSIETRQDGLDPLYGSAPRRSWSAGLRLALTKPPSAEPPVPAEYSGGRATLALPASEAQGRPHVGGSFNDWTPEPMERDGDRWTWTAPLEPGVYEYAFRTADGEWFVPESTPGRKDDGMGGVVALLVVEEPEP